MYFSSLSALKAFSLYIFNSFLILLSLLPLFCYLDKYLHKIKKYFIANECYLHFMLSKDNSEIGMFLGGRWTFFGLSEHYLSVATNLLSDFFAGQTFLEPISTFDMHLITSDSM